MNSLSLPGSLSFNVDLIDEKISGNVLSNLAFLAGVSSSHTQTLHQFLGTYNATMYHSVMYYSHDSLYQRFAESTSTR